jgi:NADPH-dependent 2,4-dienoyl-CoA reductase/sulfur reductase-like enzyme
MAVGVKPNTDFLKEGSLNIERGIVVDKNMKTSIEDVYAAGDVAQSLDLISEAGSNIAIWPLAVQQGYIAGLNMAGGPGEYKGGLR